MDFSVEVSDYRDFMMTLQPGSVDLILTDPPYSISKKTGFKSVKNGVKRFAVDMDFGKWDHSEINLDVMSYLFYRSLREGGTAIVWYDIWKIGEVKEAMEKEGFVMLRQLIWQKTNPVPLNSKCTYLSNSREMAVVGVKKGKPTFHGKYDNGVYSSPIHREKRFHSTQKPIALFEKLIQKHSNEGDTIADPFLGAGTTCIAALKNSRKFVGCDKSMEYVDISKKRVENEL